MNLINISWSLERGRTLKKSRVSLHGSAKGALSLHIQKQEQPEMSFCLLQRAAVVRDASILNLPTHHLQSARFNHPTLTYSRLDVCEIMIGQELLSVAMGDWLFLWRA